MVRYWVFLAFAVGYSVYQGSLRAACRSRHPYQQVIRALIGVGEIVLFGLGSRYLGLAEMHALYAVFRLMTLALTGEFLGECMGVSRWGAAAIGLTGTWIIVRSGTGVFEVGRQCGR